MTAKIVRADVAPRTKDEILIPPVEYRSAPSIGINPNYVHVDSDDTCIEVSFFENGDICRLYLNMGDRVFLLENGKTVDSWKA